MNITKLDLCNRVAKRITDTPVPVGYLKPVLETFLDEILCVLSEGRRIEIRGFGSFKTKNKKVRTGRNPRTGDKVEIPAHTAIAFKFSRDATKIFSDKLGKVKKPKKEPVTI
jgi:nucleoid DNA-binding protein